MSAPAAAVDRPFGVRETYRSGVRPAARKECRAHRPRDRCSIEGPILYGRDVSQFVGKSEWAERRCGRSPDLWKGRHRKESSMKCKFFIDSDELGS